jgi:DNA recombination protein RmuC
MELLRLLAERSLAARRGDAETLRTTLAGMEQFAAMQKAMCEVQAVTAQISDIKRQYGSVKTRGGWGEAQLRAMLDDILPAGTFEAKWRPHAETEDVRDSPTYTGAGAVKTSLPLDVKFRMEYYELLLAANEADDAEAERASRRVLERRVHDESKEWPPNA